MPCLERTRDRIHPRHTDGTPAAPHARRPAVASRAMRRSRRLALALSVVALGAPALAVAETAPEPAVPAPTQAKSPFTADRLSSKPTGLTPNSATSPVLYPEQAVVLRWGDVPGAVGYTVEIADNPGFSRVVWSAEVAMAMAAPEILLPDGGYWWRVQAIDQAGTKGLWSDVARVAKSWPNRIAGLRLTSTPLGGPVTHTALNPYLFWDPVPGAKSYDVEVTPGDQFNNVTFAGHNLPQPFASPAAVGAIPDDTYSWRVRARDANGNPGPWTVAPNPFTKAWTAPVPRTPADDPITPVGDLLFSWDPVEGAERYQIQVTNQQFNWVGPSLKIDATTSANGFVPSLAEERAKAMGYGRLWWRVRPIIGGVYGTWSEPWTVNWQAPSGSPAPPTLTSTGDTDTGLSPQLSWTPVAGMKLYRVDTATDPQFNNIVESELTTSTSWVSRNPLPDNQLGTGYHWRVVWGDGVTVEDPGWKVDEHLAPKATYRKQTRVTLSSPVNGGTVSDPPVLTWGAVPGIAKYSVELSQDGQFSPTSTRTATLFGQGAVPGSMSDGERRLSEGTWYWRARAVDGGGAGQTWSPVGSFTLTSPRPTQREPNDGSTVVFSPLLSWSPVPGAVGYDVQVARDPSFASAGGTDEVLETAQTSLVPPRSRITTPGVHYWRVRADYGDEITGQWSPTRSFRSVFPPSFNLNSVPRRVDFRRKLVLSGQLKNNGRPVRRARLILERRVWPNDAYRPAGVVRTSTSGRFRFALRMTRTTDFRLVWPASNTHPEGTASFGIQVQPRVSFRLTTSRIARKRVLKVKGTIFPRRPAAIQMRTSDGWKTIRKIKPRRARFSVGVGTKRLDPGKHRLRLWVPRDKRRKLVNKASRQRGVLIYDRFLIR